MNRKLLIVIVVLLIIIAGGLVGIKIVGEGLPPGGGTSGQIEGANPDPIAKDAKGSEIDFDALTARNPDICGWLRIDGTDIDHPVLQDGAAADADAYGSGAESDFYLTHDSDRKPSKAGALFIDTYNNRDYNDPVTIIYGHQMMSGEFFGNLQRDYDTEDAFAEHEIITLFTPEGTHSYEAFAAVPYDPIHILYNYDFEDYYQHYVFFDRIFAVRSLNAVLHEERYPEFGEHVLILSTCLQGDSSNRYLVMGREIDHDTE